MSSPRRSSGHCSWGSGRSTCSQVSSSFKNIHFLPRARKNFLTSFPCICDNNLFFPFGFLLGMMLFLFRPTASAKSLAARRCKRRRRSSPEQRAWQQRRQWRRRFLSVDRHWREMRAQGMICCTRRSCYWDEERKEKGS